MTPLRRIEFASSDPLEIRDFLHRVRGSQVLLNGARDRGWRVSPTQVDPGEFSSSEMRLPRRYQRPARRPRRRGRPAGPRIGRAAARRHRPGRLPEHPGHRAARPRPARRLDQAHRQLQAADPEHESVTAVAYRWGFSSPSRFATYYRRACGVPPSQTLRN